MWKAVALASKRYQSSETGQNGQHSAASQYQAIENGSLENHNNQMMDTSTGQQSFDDGQGMEIEEMDSL